MAPIRVTSARGVVKYSVRKAHPERPGVRVNVGRFDTLAEALEAERRFMRLDRIPDDMKVTFRNVRTRCDGTWEVFFEGVWQGSFGTMHDAAHAVRRAMSNETQRKRRALKSDLRARRTRLEERAKAARATAKARAEEARARALDVTPFFWDEMIQYELMF